MSNRIEEETIMNVKQILEHLQNSNNDNIIIGTNQNCCFLKQSWSFSYFHFNVKNINSNVNRHLMNLNTNVHKEFKNAFGHINTCSYHLFTMKSIRLVSLR